MGLSVTAIFDGSLLWCESWAYAQEILRDPDSHTTHSIAGSAYVPPAAERVGFTLFEGELNSKRQKNTIAIKIPRPWVATPGATETRLVAEDNPERLAALARLNKLVPDSPQGAPDI